ncbi:MAG: 6-phosphofructokinase [Anaerolineae bacterium]
MRTLIVVSGGDAPGINATIAHYTALEPDALGAQGGFAGVLNQHIEPIQRQHLHTGYGGSYLASSREPVLAAADAPEKMRAALAAFQVDNILLFGGNGTLRHVLPLLEEWGIPTIGLPTTIDNDVPGTERTLGFDSACNYAYQAVEGVRATAGALPGRIFMVETLGGDTGYLALEVAAGAGAHLALLPEYEPYDEMWLAARLQYAIATYGHALVVLSEGVKIIPRLEEMIPRLTGVRLRYTKLGHAQRGGITTHLDRRLAFDMARLAHVAFNNGIQMGVVVVQQGQPTLNTHRLPETKELPDKALHDWINGL